MRMRYQKEVGKSPFPRVQPAPMILFSTFTIILPFGKVSANFLLDTTESLK